MEQPAISKTKSWDHQAEAFHFAMAKRGVMLALRMGEGKSKIAIDVAANSGAMKTLILTPARAIGVWPREYERHSGVPTKVVPLVKGNTADKVRTAAEALSVGQTNGQPVAIVVNYETAIRPEFQKFATTRLWDLIICDEIHRGKSPNGATGKLIGKLGHVAKKKLGLSGTPLPHSSLDIFSQYRFLDPSIFGYSYVKFRQRYAKMNAMFPSKVDGWLNQDELKEKFAQIAFRVEEDVLDLPPYTEQFLTCDLSPKCRKIYDELESQLITEIEAGTVTAANALVKIIRLQQCTSGFLKTEDGIEQQIDDAKERLLAGIIEDIDITDPVVAFCRFRRDLDAAARVAEMFGRRYGEISSRRADLTAHAEMKPDIDLMGVQIQSGGTGIDLTRSRYGVYFSIDFNKGSFDQSEARIHRPGQTRPVHYMHLIAENTIDRAVYGALAKREDLVSGVLAALKRKE